MNRSLGYYSQSQKCKCVGGGGGVCVCVWVWVCGCVGGGGGGVLAVFACVHAPFLYLCEEINCLIT